MPENSVYNDTPQKHNLRFRQVHLDFHTSPDIPGIGESFEKKLWQERLQMMHADSITCFSCCHHGMSYHPTEVGVMHPELKFDLLRAQIDAAHEIGVKVPVYISAGFNDSAALKNPGWRQISVTGEFSGRQVSPLEANFQFLCFNSPYMDYLCRLTEEAARMFPDADGMFFDIILQRQCCCPYCMHDMRKQGFDPAKEEDRIIFSQQVIENYMKKINAAARIVNPDMPVFHNNGGALLNPGNEKFYQYFSHFEVESLPTGGWGYDHFPLLAAFCRTQKNVDFLGMTGKFHTSWGEFGGFKAANALRYECCAMLAQGARCSVGDQLHPAGMLDESTCRLIGKAYKEVEEKEAWCTGVQPVSNVAMLSNTGFAHPLKPDETVEIGVSRLLLENHIPFERFDAVTSWEDYKVVILADDLRPDAALRQKLDKFIKKGGKVIISGRSLLKAEDDTPAFDLPLTWHGETAQFPNFMQTAPEFAPDGVTTPFVMYRPSQNIKISGEGRSLGTVFDPYFVRSYRHFCSHQHTPNKLENNGFAAGVMTENILYFSHPVFTLYALYGAVILKEFLGKCIKSFIGEDLQITTNLPSTGRVSILEQAGEKRYILHALYAPPALRGMASEKFTSEMFQTIPVQIIEDLPPFHDAVFSLRLPQKIRKVTLEPQGKEIDFTETNGIISLTLDKLICHQMIVLHY